MRRTGEDEFSRDTILERGDGGGESSDIDLLPRARRGRGEVERERRCRWRASSLTTICM